ncbi:hypothetical protein ACQ86N_06155 [Puia sp. P3]|uniref:hypothetical protein n=1 Tax=Puia sp. P3 TaxID=3423952 RepID=UPI003D66F641
MYVFDTGGKPEEFAHEAQGRVCRYYSVRRFLIGLPVSARMVRSVMTVRISTRMGKRVRRKVMGVIVIR